MRDHLILAQRAQQTEEADAFAGAVGDGKPSIDGAEGNQ